ncbi:MAG: DUF1844 domain-containing protein [Lacisediminihabitans sp.]
MSDTGHDHVIHDHVITEPESLEPAHIKVEAAGGAAARDIADVPAVEIINTVAVHLLSAAAVKCGLADDPDTQTDLDEARRLIDAMAGLITASAAGLGDHHARALRDGLRSVQLAFREASPFPDKPGEGAGEKWTGPVN